MKGTWRPIVAVGAMLLSFAWWYAQDISQADRAPKPQPVAQRAVDSGSTQQ
ncbi:MAG TPA: hypothetical protein VLH58_10765 [Candidatus Methylomirabilis sp.]|nr:hypothetical protein [Candidatus Methylomirabilis sp.]HSC71827.1 hypothetical protein [Candidatus Methylomirabilis sp.]